HPREHARTALHVLALEADPVGQAQPQLEPAFALALSIMVADPPRPQAAKGRVLRLGDDECVFDGNPRLVVVAVAHPLLELAARRPASRARLPSSPPIGRCAMSRACLDPRPSSMSSRSDQKVPSKNTQSAPSTRPSTAASTAPVDEAYASVRPVLGSRIRRPT